MSAELFDSMNLYENLVVLRADTPEELVIMIKSVKTPIKIVSIVASNNRHYAYLIGDIRIKKTKKEK